VFTLIELIVVTSVILILISILLPALKKARDMSKRLHCINNEKSIGHGVLMYASDNQGYIPQTGGAYTAWSINSEWQEYIAKEYLAYPQPQYPGSFICPSHETPFNLHGLLSSYGFNYWIQDPLLLRLSASSRPSELLMHGDSASGRFLIRGPISLTGSVIHLRHTGGANLTFLDGHVEWRQVGELSDYSASDPFWVNF
jgi:prepilin-type processing-associated H-X9-DG protein